MAESVLSKLVKTDKETRDRMVSIDKTLQSMLLQDKKENKDEAKRRKKEDQRNKRKSGDRNISKKIVGDKRKEKKEKKGLLDGLLGGLGDGITGLIKGPAMIAALGAGLAGGLAAALAFPQVRKGIFDMLRRGLKFIETDVIPTTFRIIKKQIIPFYTETIFPLILQAAKKIGQVVSDIFYDKVMVPLTGWASKIRIMGMGLGVEALPARGTSGFNLREEAAQAESDLTNPALVGEDKEKAERIVYDNERMKSHVKKKSDLETTIKGKEAQVSRIQKIIDQMEERKEKLNGGYGTKKFENVIARETKSRERVEAEIDQLKGFVKEHEGIIIKLDQQYQPPPPTETQTETQTDKPKDKPVGKQSGGPITVPGRSTGDKHPALLPPGSFVLNRNAAGYQNGGVPAMLESGEKVFGPGQWGMKEFMLNSAIPRFQEGGEVDPTRKPKEGEISSSSLGDLIFKDGKWKTYDPNKEKPTKDTTEEPTIKEGKDRKKGEGGAAAIIAAGKQLLKDGFTVAEHPNFDKQRGFRPEGDARVGSHSPGSLHYSNQALDVTDWRSGDWLGRTKGLAETVYQKKDDMKLTQIIHDPWGSWFDGGGKQGAVGGHDTHLHLGFAEGKAGDTGSLGGNKGNSGGGNKGSGLLGFLANMAGPVGKALMQFIKGVSSSISSILGGDSGGFLSSLFGSFGGGGGDNNTESGAGVGPAGAGGAGATSVDDPNAKALLNAIADAEGTSQYADQGYKTHFGGKQWQGQGYPKDHPRQDTGGSNAFGRYQFMSDTWDEFKGNRDMSPAGQDAVALDLITKKRKVNLSDGLSKKEVQELSWEWASIKGNNYKFNGAAQGKVGQDKFLGMYESYGGKIEGMQTGGVANISPSTSSAFPQKAEDAFINNLAEAMQPVVVPIPMGGGGGGQQVTSTGGSPLPPTLSANPNNPIALDLAYRLSAGASFA